MPLPEKTLIDRIRARSRTGASLAVGIGDDCAVLRIPPGHEMLVTTDFTLEGIHFRREWHSPEVVGRRCLTRGLSDIAAMGADPVAAFLSLALPAGVSQKWVDGFIKGLLALASEFRVPLAGGDIAESTTGVLADIVVVGSVPQGCAVLRSGAKPGEQIYVTGSLGGSAAAIANLRRKEKVRARDYERHFHPIPRLKQGAWVRQRDLTSAMIDLSDGLSTDLEHICKESGVGAEVDAEAIPLATVGSPPRPVRRDLALHGGEDYELLFTSSQRIPSKIAGVSVTRIGRITRKPGMRLIESDGKAVKLLPRGWEHFTRKL